MLMFLCSSIPALMLAPSSEEEWITPILLTDVTPEPSREASYIARRYIILPSVL